MENNNKNNENNNKSKYKNLILLFIMCTLVTLLFFVTRNHMDKLKTIFNNKINSDLNNDTIMNDNNFVNIISKI